jgi:hypothetical protein
MQILSASENLSKRNVLREDQTELTLLDVV